MNLKSFLLLLSLLSVQICQAQYYEKPSSSASTAAVELGKPYDVVDASAKYYFYRDGEILTVKLAGKKIILQKLDADLLKFKQVRIHDDFPKGFQVEGIKMYNDRYYFFYSLWDDKNETEQLFCREINFDDLSFKGDAKRIVAVEGKITGSPIGYINYFWSFGVTDKFDFQFSYDKSKMLLPNTE